MSEASVHASTPSTLTAAQGPHAPPRSIAPALVRIWVRALDAALITTMGSALVLILLPGHERFEAGDWLALLAGPLLALLFIDQAGGYRLSTLKNAAGRAWRVMAGWAAAMAVLLAAAFFLKAGAEVSRGWIALWFVSGLFALLIGRVAVARSVRTLAAAGRLDRRAVIVGGGAPAEAVIRALQASRSAHVRLLGLFDDRDATRTGVIAGHPCLGSVADLVAFARREPIDLVIVALPLSAEARLLTVLKQLWVLPVDIRISAHATRLRFRPRAYSRIGDVPFLDVFDRPLNGFDAVKKAVFDRVIGALALLALSPVMLLTALAVRLDSPGPVLFRQKRYGFNNELIEVFKFRSMYVEQSDATAARLVTKGDPRVTRVGRFIRKTSLDELPQLVNVVVKGNLSLVGPRPHAVHAKAADALYQDVVDGYYARHKVKPGITGWAQVNGWRGETDTPEKIQRRVEHDLDYMERWSLLFDAYIVLITPFALLTKSENAY